MNRKNKQSAFTLIELLIVIAVIGILAGILVSILNVKEYQAQARDARRLNDLLSVHTAIINSIASGNIALVDTSTCNTCSSTTGTSNIDGTGWVKFTNLKNRGLIDVISVLPEDPLNEEDYIFYYYSDGVDFELNMKFESQKYAISAQKDGGNDDQLYERGFRLNLK